MMKNKFLYLLLSLSISLSSTIVAFADVDGYVIKDEANVSHEYNIEDLTESLMSDGIFYNQFYNQLKKYGVYAYHDNSDKYVSQESVVEALLQEDNFNLNKFISSEKSKSIKIDNVKKVKNNSSTEANSSTDTNTNTNTNNIDIKKAKANIKDAKDLEKYLNENFGKLNTPIHDWKFKIQVLKNKYQYKDINTTIPYDYCLMIDWEGNFNPIELLPSSKTYSDKDKIDTINLLVNHQEQLYNFLNAIYPNDKIISTFYAKNENKRFTGKVGAIIRFLTWTNYTNPSTMYYIGTEHSDFQWFFGNDTIEFDIE